MRSLRKGLAWSAIARADVCMPVKGQVCVGGMSKALRCCGDGARRQPLQEQCSCATRHCATTHNQPAHTTSCSISQRRSAAASPCRPKRCAHWVVRLHPHAYPGGTGAYGTYAPPPPVTVSCIDTLTGLAIPYSMSAQYSSAVQQAQVHARTCACRLRFHWLGFNEQQSAERGLPVYRAVRRPRGLTASLVALHHPCIRPTSC